MVHPRACGESPPGRAAGTPAAVHPRACGESATATADGGRRWGPSPRVRGIHVTPSPSLPKSRSIPARAGNPRPAPDDGAPTGVHPRACGESARSVFPSGRSPGPSPRVRGIHDEAQIRRARGGSIPARAGNPSSRRAARSGRRVHPRACGESHRRPLHLGGAPGPSPRVRGIHDEAQIRRARGGSIPARAGNPPSSRCRSGT